MCLTVSSGELTAEEDIIVYKIIQEDNKSLHQNFQYTPNTRYKLQGELNPIVTASNLVLIKEGFHAFVNPNYAIPALCVKFTIPKGAKYYLGKHNNIVSNEIISGDLKRNRNFKFSTEFEIETINDKMRFASFFCTAKLTDCPVAYLQKVYDELLKIDNFYHWVASKKALENVMKELKKGQENEP